MTLPPPNPFLSPLSQLLESWVNRGTSADAEALLVAEQLHGSQLVVHLQQPYMYLFLTMEKGHCRISMTRPDPGTASSEVMLSGSLSGLLCLLAERHDPFHVLECHFRVTGDPELLLLWVRYLSCLRPDLAAFVKDEVWHDADVVTVTDLIRTGAACLQDGLRCWMSTKPWEDHHGSASGRNGGFSSPVGERTPQARSGSVYASAATRRMPGDD